MTTKTVDMSERAFQASVIEYARLKGWKVAHHHDSRRQVRPGVLVGDSDAAGLPDLLLVRRCRLIFAELKREKGQVSKAQEDWLKELADVEAASYGTVEARVWRPSQWPQIERSLA